MPPFDLDDFVADLETLVGFPTISCRNPAAFQRAYEWIADFLADSPVELVEFDCHGLTSVIAKPVGSTRPRMIGDGHLDVVPAQPEMFSLRRRDGRLWGRGVADMKTQVLAMLWVMRNLAGGEHHDFWLVLAADEEVGSAGGVAVVLDYLVANDLVPRVVFAPDGGPDFGYVEREKGIATFTVATGGVAAHVSRPYLADNAIEQMMGLYSKLQARFPNPVSEQDWRASLSMTQISAGDVPNRIPDEATAVFDLRFTEDKPDEIRSVVRELASAHDAIVDFQKVDQATYYPKEAPVARRFIEMLADIAAKPPRIIHSAGASNGRLYAEAGEVHVLMSNPMACGAHSGDEWVEVDSLEPYYDLVYRTATMEL